MVILSKRQLLDQLRPETADDPNGAEPAMKLAYMAIMFCNTQQRCAHRYKTERNQPRVIHLQKEIATILDRIGATYTIGNDAHDFADAGAFVLVECPDLPYQPGDVVLPLIDRINEFCKVRYFVKESGNDFAAYKYRVVIEELLNEGVEHVVELNEIELSVKSLRNES